MGKTLPTWMSWLSNPTHFENDLAHGGASATSKVSKYMRNGGLSQSRHVHEMLSGVKHGPAYRMMYDLNANYWRLRKRYTPAMVGRLLEQGGVPLRASGTFEDHQEDVARMTDAMRNHQILPMDLSRAAVTSFMAKRAGGDMHDHPNYAHMRRISTSLTESGVMQRFNHADPLMASLYPSNFTQHDKDYLNHYLYWTARQQMQKANKATKTAAVKTETLLETLASAGLDKTLRIRHSEVEQRLDRSSYDANLSTIPIITWGGTYVPLYYDQWCEANLEPLRGEPVYSTNYAKTDNPSNAAKRSDNIGKPQQPQQQQQGAGAPPAGAAAPAATPAGVPLVPYAQAANAHEGHEVHQAVHTSRHGLDDYVRASGKSDIRTEVDSHEEPLKTAAAQALEEGEMAGIRDSKEEETKETKARATVGVKPQSKPEPFRLPKAPPRQPGARHPPVPPASGGSAAPGKRSVKEPVKTREAEMLAHGEGVLMPHPAEAPPVHSKVGDPKAPPSFKKAPPSAAAPVAVSAPVSTASAADMDTTVSHAPTVKAPLKPTPLFPTAAPSTDRPQLLEELHNPELTVAKIMERERYHTAEPPSQRKPPTSGGAAPPPVPVPVVDPWEEYKEQAEKRLLEIRYAKTGKFIHPNTIRDAQRIAKQGYIRHVGDVEAEVLPWVKDYHANKEKFTKEYIEQAVKAEGGQGVPRNPRELQAYKEKVFDRIKTIDPFERQAIFNRKWRVGDESPHLHLGASLQRDIEQAYDDYERAWTTDRNTPEPHFWRKPEAAAVTMDTSVGPTVPAKADAAAKVDVASTPAVLTPPPSRAETFTPAPMVLPEAPRVESMRGGLSMPMARATQDLRAPVPAIVEQSMQPAWERVAEVRSQLDEAKRAFIAPSTTSPLGMSAPATEPARVSAHPPPSMDVSVHAAPPTPAAAPPPSSGPSKREMELLQYVNQLNKSLMLKDLELSRYETERDIPQRHIEELQRTIQAKEDQLSELQSQQALPQRQIEELRQALQAKDGKISELEKQQKGKPPAPDNDVERLQKELSYLQRQYVELQAKAAQKQPEEFLDAEAQASMALLGKAPAVPDALSQSASAPLDADLMLGLQKAKIVAEQRYIEVQAELTEKNAKIKDLQTDLDMALEHGQQVVLAAEKQLKESAALKAKLERELSKIVPGALTEGQERNYQRRIQEAEASRLEAQELIARKTAETERLKQDMTSRLANVTSERDAKQARLAEMTETLAESDRRHNRLQAELRTQQFTIQDLNDRIKTTTDELTRVSDERARAEGALKAQKMAVETQLSGELQEAQKELRKVKAESMTSKHQLERELQEKSHALTQLEQEKAQRDKELSARDKALQIATAEKTQLEGQVAELQRLQADSRAGGLEMNLRSRTQELEQAQATIADHQRIIATLQEENRQAHMTHLGLTSELNGMAQSKHEYDQLLGNKQRELETMRQHMDELVQQRDALQHAKTSGALDPQVQHLMDQIRAENDDLRGHIEKLGAAFEKERKEAYGKHAVEMSAQFAKITELQHQLTAVTEEAQKKEIEMSARYLEAEGNYKKQIGLVENQREQLENEVKYWQEEYTKGTAAQAELTKQSAHYEDLLRDFTEGYEKDKQKRAAELNNLQEVANRKEDYIQEITAAHDAKMADMDKALKEMYDRYSANLDEERGHHAEHMAAWQKKIADVEAQQTSMNDKYREHLNILQTENEEIKAQIQKMGLENRQMRERQELDLISIHDMTKALEHEKATIEQHKKDSVKIQEMAAAEKAALGKEISGLKSRIIDMGEQRKLVELKAQVPVLKLKAQLTEIQGTHAYQMRKMQEELQQRIEAQADTTAAARQAATQLHAAKLGQGTAEKATADVTAQYEQKLADMGRQHLAAMSESEKSRTTAIQDFTSRNDALSKQLADLQTAVSAAKAERDAALSRGVSDAGLAKLQDQVSPHLANIDQQLNALKESEAHALKLSQSAIESVKQAHTAELATRQEALTAQVAKTETLERERAGLARTLEEATAKTADPANISKLQAQLKEVDAQKSALDANIGQSTQATELHIGMAAQLEKSMEARHFAQQTELEMKVKSLEGQREDILAAVQGKPPRQDAEKAASTTASSKAMPASKAIADHLKAKTDEAVADALAKVKRLRQEAGITPFTDFVTQTKAILPQAPLQSPTDQEVSKLAKLAKPQGPVKVSPQLQGNFQNAMKAARPPPPLDLPQNMKTRDDLDHFYVKNRTRLLAQADQVLANKATDETVPEEAARLNHFIKTFGYIVHDGKTRLFSPDNKKTFAAATVKAAERLQQLEVSHSTLLAPTFARGAQTKEFSKDIQRLATAYHEDNDNEGSRRRPVRRNRAETEADDVEAEEAEGPRIIAQSRGASKAPSLVVQQAGPKAGVKRRTLMDPEQKRQLPPAGMDTDADAFNASDDAYYGQGINGEMARLLGLPPVLP